MSESRAARSVTLVAAMILVVGSLLALAACGSVVEKKIEKEMEKTLEAEGKNADVNIDDESGSITITGDDGDAAMSFGEAATVPDGFPQDLLPADAEIQSVISVEEGPALMQSVTFRSDTSSEDMYEWFLEALPKAGYEIENKMEFDAGGSKGFNIAGSGAADDCNVSGAGEEGKFIYTVAIIPK